MKRIIVSKQNKSQAINDAVEVLNSGGLVIFPTETCYGVAAKAIDQNAVDKMLKYKRRPEGKAISIAVASKEMASKYVDISDSAEGVYTSFLPGPVTVISKSKGKVALGLASERDTLGIRIPDYELALELITKLGTPISSSSANTAGKKTPYSVEDILRNISQKQEKLIDLILDVGELEHNPPSTVIDTTKQDMQVIREGRINLNSNVEVYKINSEKEMQGLGRKLIEERTNVLASKALVILFNAELGAGKTQLTKGVAAGLGIDEVVTSPTYTLIEEYPYKNGMLVHFDAWRMESLKELSQLDFEKYIQAGNIIAIEWAGATVDYFREFITNKPVELIEINIEYTSLTTREVKIYK